MKQRAASRANGPYANGAAALDTLALAAAGLTLVRHLDVVAGKVIGETVIPTDEIDPTWMPQLQRPPRPCGACHQDAWRLDRGTMTTYICGECHP